MVSFEHFLQITYFLRKKKILLCVYSCIMNASQEPYVDHPYICDSDLAQWKEEQADDDKMLYNI